jgi:hypothetical protein
MTLDATVGGANANSWGTVAEAEAYFATRLFSTVWTSLSADDKPIALIAGTRAIQSKVTEDWTKANLLGDGTKRILTELTTDENCNVVWTGEPTDAIQALLWPRIGMKTPTGFDLASDVIPQRLKEFQFEVSLKLAEADRTNENAATAQGLQSLTAGPVSLGWKDTAPNPLTFPNVLFKNLVPSWWYAFELKMTTRATVDVLF